MPMSTTQLRRLAIILPILFWIAQVEARTLLFGETRTLAGDLFALAALLVAAVAFSDWVFGIVARREAEIRRRTEQLDAIREAVLTLTTELDLATVLQKVVDLSRMLVGARYGALGVLGADGRYITQFITSGITPEQRAALGELPRGHGLLGVLIKEGKPIRIPEIARDPRSSGFPPHHPPMHSLLGVPIISKGKVIGDLYMTDKKSESRRNSAYTVFTPQDEQALEMFAAQAAIAIENAQLYRQTQELAVLQERERIGMDLHDGIIQSIYAIGLTLEDAQYRVDKEPQQASARISSAVGRLNDVIRDIRNYILDLRPQRFRGRDLQSGLEELARELRANTFLEVKLQVDADAHSLTAEQTSEVLHIAQEALTNVRKHAQATQVDIWLGEAQGELQFSVSDNGVGIDLRELERATGHGLRNMRERAAALGGVVALEPRAEGGTRFSLRVPQKQ